MIDEDGGVIRTRAAIEALIAALRDSLLFDEVISVRAASDTAVEVRAGGVTAEHGRVVVCAGRGTATLARGAGLPLPVRQFAHVRLTYRVRGDAPARLACLQDSSGAFGEARAYADPLPGNRFYAVGLGETAVHEDGSLLDPSGLAAAAERTNAYVGLALPGVEPRPTHARHCWFTRGALEPGRHRRVGSRRAALRRGQQPLQARSGARPRPRARRARRRPHGHSATTGQTRRRGLQSGWRMTGRLPAPA